MNSTTSVNWIHNNSVFDPTPDELSRWVGFVYLITNTSTQQKYIGKKVFQVSKFHVVKGKRKRHKVESNWRSYWGSNDNLLADVKELGEHNFTREILHLCISKSECSYLEVREQLARDVLLREDYYNHWISVRIHGKNLLKGLPELAKSLKL